MYKTLIQIVRLLSRVLSMILPKDLLDQLKCKNYRMNSMMDIKKNPKGLAQFLPKETNSTLMKLGFLMLVKTSNSLFVPKKATNV